MKIGNRIYLGFGLSIALLLVVAALSQFTSARMADRMEEQVVTTRTAGEIVSIEREMARLRYLAGLVVRQGGEGPERDAEELHDKIVERLKALESAPQSANQGLLLREMSDRFSQFWTSYKEVRRLMGERARLGEREIPALGREIRLGFAEIIRFAGERNGSAELAADSSVAEEKLMLARLAIQNYYQSTDPAAAQEAKRLLQEGMTRAGQLRPLLDATPMQPRLGGILAGFPRLNALLDELIGLTLQQQAMLERMDEAASGNSTLAKSLSEERDWALGVLGGQIAEETRQDQWLALLVSTFALLLAAFGAWRTGRSITKPLSAITSTIGRITQGDHTVSIPSVMAHDEIGELARAASEIKELVAWSETQRWTQTALTELGRKLQEAVTARDLADVVAQTFAQRLGCAHAAVYLATPSGRLEFGGGFGLGNLETTPSFAIGEGMVGSCAARREPLWLEQLPASYLRIRSGLGEGAPEAVVLIPILHKESLHGVVELASFHPFTAVHREFLEEAGQLLGLYYETANRHQRTRELLEETQRQSAALVASEEELRTQSEELRTTTEDLRSLNQRLIEQKRELEQANDLHARTAEELAIASRHKSEFLANMSHELRTPLNSLLILAKDLAANRGNRLNGEEVESARVIHEAGHHLLEVINDILDLSKVEAGRLRLQAQQVELPALIDRVTRRFAPEAEAKGLQFHVKRLDSAPAALWTDPGRVEQILNNLLSNAIKFTPLGEVELAVAGAEGGDVVIAVADSGVGIEQKDMERVFEAFERVENPSAAGGTGLGLAISRRLAGLLGGALGARSTPGQGSCFTLRLPARMPEADLTEEAVEAGAGLSPLSKGAPAAEGAGRTIVVIEDDPLFAKLLVRYAEQRGLDCAVARNGREGLEAVRRLRPAGVILDLGLPDMDGMELLDRLKGDGALSRIPVHIISGREGREQALALGAEGVLMKPVSDVEIGRLLEKVAGGPRRVLLAVEDEPTGIAFGALLGQRGVETVTVPDGESALARLGAERFGCLVVDLALPRHGGLELLREARRLIGKLPPVVVITETEPSIELSLELREFTDALVLKGEAAPDRILDEVSLFLHKLNPGGQEFNPPPAEEQVLANRTVLVADDDLRNAFALSKVLRQRGLKVLLAQNGRKALAALDQAPRVDAVLMDIMMPEMDGYEAIQAIRAQPKWREVPIIALTAKAMRGERQRCLEMGASDYLSKPVDIDELIRCLCRWIGN